MEAQVHNLFLTITLIRPCLYTHILHTLSMDASATAFTPDSRDDSGDTPMLTMPSAASKVCNLHRSVLELLKISP